MQADEQIGSLGPRLLRPIGKVDKIVAGSREAHLEPSLGEPRPQFLCQEQCIGLFLLAPILVPGILPAMARIEADAGNFLPWTVVRRTKHRLQRRGEIDRWDTRRATAEGHGPR